MANVGLSKPFYASYSVSGSTVTYGTPAALGKAVSASIELDSADPTVLYADNGPSESYSTFAGGTLNLTIDNLSLEAAGAILGITPTSSTTPAGSTMDFPADQNIPYVGFAVIAKKVVSGATKYLAIILPKVQFQMPNDTYETQGETITFNTPELSATIMRDDTASGIWKKYGEFATEADAVTWINGFFRG